MEPNTSGFFFRSHARQGLYNMNLLRLDDAVDVTLLERAWRQTLDDVPFFEQGVVVQDDALWYVEHRSTCTVKDATPLMKRGGPDLEARDLAWAKAAGSALMVGVSHALTDEYGKKLFTELLLYHYFCLVDDVTYPNPYAGEDGNVPVNTTADLLGEPFLKDVAAAPLRLPSHEHFRFPELALEGQTPTTLCVSVDARAFYAACRTAFPVDDAVYGAAMETLLPIGRLQCLFVFWLMAASIARAEPGNTLPVSVRFPVNVRPIVGCPYALRNFSLPQVVTSAEASRLGKPLDEREATRLVSEVSSQLLPSSIGWQLEGMRAAVRGEGLPADVAALFHQTMICSNVGREYFEPTLGRVTQDLRFAAGDYPMAIYLNRLGDRQLIVVSQGFASDRYFQGFVAELKSYGLDAQCLSDR